MICIANGTVYTGKKEVLKDTDILIENGKIKAIGKNLKEKAETVIDASGKAVLPGFIDGMSELGLAMRRGEVRDNDEKCDPLTPHLKTLYAYDGDCVMEQAPYSYGITSVCASPSHSNILGGQMAVFKTYGINPYKMLVKDEVAMKGSVSKSVKDAYGARNIMPMTKMGIFSALDKALKDAKEDEGKKRNEKNLALKKVLDQKMPLVMAAFDNTEIRSVVRISEKYGIKPILGLGFDLHEEDLDLADKIQGIVLGNLANGFNAINDKADLEAIYSFYKKGVPVCMATMGTGTNGKEGLLWNATQMMQAARNADDVLAMMTSDAAKMYGVADRVGAIEEGLDADIVIWSANPIETWQGAVEKVFINGEQIFAWGGNK